MSINTELELFLQISVAIGLIYRIAKAESTVYETIDSVKDRLSEVKANIDSDLKMLDYRLKEVERDIDVETKELKILERAIRDMGVNMRTRKEDIT